MVSSLSNISTARIVNNSYMYTDCSVELHVVTMAHAHRVFDFAKAIWLVKNLL